MAEGRALGTARRALGAVARAGLWFSVLLLVAMAVLVAGQVLMRNVFALGLPWADELARWFGIALVYLTIPHLLDRGSHIAVELLPNRLKGRWKTAVLVFAELSVAASPHSAWWHSRVSLNARRASRRRRCNCPTRSSTCPPLSASCCWP